MQGTAVGMTATSSGKKRIKIPHVYYCYDAFVHIKMKANIPSSI